MALHRLTSITMGVPNVAETAAYYEEFGLVADDGGWLSTRDGGRQLRIVYAPTRRLVDLCVGVDDEDDLNRIERNLGGMAISVVRGDNDLSAVEEATGTRAHVEIAARFEQCSVPAAVCNGPGRYERSGQRAPGVMRHDRVRPRKLGHAVLGSTDFERSRAFFVGGLGFKVSDHIKGAGTFMRCSTDHHNVLVLNAPVSFLHHTAWQVDDIDEIGRGAQSMLAADPARHVWGLGRHYGGSNFFWYLKDPAGNFSEYYSDMDCIVDDQLWTPEDLQGAQGLFAWGPPPPPAVLQPADLAAMMVGAHRPS
jgi:catechol 2,3-dioxygenase-like lactoylglutathione lyase family enzyme